MSKKQMTEEDKLRDETVREVAKTIMQPVEDALKRFDPLLSRISAETIVLHFAYWLELQYFETDHNYFYENFITYRNVLQKCLLLKSLNNGSRPSSKSLTETNTATNQYFRQIYKTKSLKGDTALLFDVILQWFLDDCSKEMFVQSGVVNNRNELTLPKDYMKEDELCKKKSVIYHTYEFELPHNDDEFDLFDKIKRANKTNTDLMLVWHIFTGERFLVKTCGHGILEQVAAERGWNPLNAIQVLMAAYYGYENKFIQPCLEAKKRRSHGGNLQPQDFFLLSMSLMPRPLDAFLKSTKDFLNNIRTPIPDTEIEAVFSDFTSDIHVPTEFDIGKEFVWLKNDYCCLFMPRLLFHPNYILTTIYGLIFQKCRQLPKYFEEWIEDLFESAKFTVSHGGHEMRDGRQLGNIDVLAFKDNTLFIIEAKLSKIRNLINDIRKLPDKFGEGGNQLNTTLQWLEKPRNQAEVLSKLGITVPFKELRIVPLIVSNSLEYDHKYFGGHLKISAFELEAAVLNWSPGTILELRLRFRHWNGQGEDEYRPLEKATKAELDDVILSCQLYPETQNCRFHTAAEVIDCIEEQRLWKLTLGEDLLRTPPFHKTFG